MHIFSFISFLTVSPTTVWFCNILDNIYTVGSAALFASSVHSGRESRPQMEVSLLASIIPSRSGAPCLATGLAGPHCSLLSAKLLNHLINISKSKTFSCSYVSLLYAIWQMDISCFGVGTAWHWAVRSFVLFVFFSYFDQFLFCLISLRIDFCREIFPGKMCVYFRNSTAL